MSENLTPIDLLRQLTLSQNTDDRVKAVEDWISNHVVEMGSNYLTDITAIRAAVDPKLNMDNIEWNLYRELNEGMLKNKAGFRTTDFEPNGTRIDRLKMWIVK